MPHPKPGESQKQNETVLEKIDKILINEWIPNKESLVYFESLAKQQKQLWNDSADYGVEADPKLKGEARAQLMQLMKTFGYKLEKWSSGSKTTVFIPVETDQGLLAGTVLNVGYDKIKGKDYLHIDIEHNTLSHKEAREKFNSKMANESVEYVNPFDLTEDRGGVGMPRAGGLWGPQLSSVGSEWCRKCNKEVKDLSKACPNCGFEGHVKDWQDRMSR